MYRSNIYIEDINLLKALKAEDDWDKERSSLTIRNNKITINAKDIIAFKATINSLIKLVEAYEKTQHLIKNGSKQRN